MAGSPYRGARTSEHKGRWNEPRQQGIISDDRQAWVTLPDFDAILFIKADLEDTGFSPDTPPVRVEFRVPGRRRNFMISLTKMTSAELAEFEKFVQHSIEKARPICALLDERAKEAFADGDDGHARLYRPVPRFYDRERLVGEHGKGVQERPERLVDEVPLQADRDVRGSHIGPLGRDPSVVDEAGTGVASGILPDSGEEALGSEHDEPEAGSTP